MDDAIEAAKESAKAIQEVAKAAGKGIDAGSALGAFVARFISGPLEQGMGIVHDKLSYMRWERQLRLMVRVEEVMRELGMEAPTRPVPIKVAIPLLQAASLEDDNELQDLWVKLLVNAADADRNVEVRRAFVSILQDFGSMEARIMRVIYAHPDEDSKEGLWTVFLPERVQSEKPKQENLRPTPDIEVALGNLGRLGCLESAMAWGGMSTPSCVHKTMLGRKLIEACTLRGEH